MRTVLGSNEIQLIAEYYKTIQTVLREDLGPNDVLYMQTWFEDLHHYVRVVIGCKDSDGHQEFNMPFTWDLDYFDHMVNSLVKFYQDGEEVKHRQFNPIE